MPHRAAQEDRLIALAQSSAWLMPALRAVRALGLAQWCIGAGAIRNLVWDSLHGHPTPTPLSDVDVAFFDAQDLTPERDARLQAQLQQALPELPWEVTNQAGVHLWFEACFGHAVAPLHSLEEAVASWPEYATAVGLTLDAAGHIRIIAPYGLDDLFAMRVRRNPARVSVETYRERLASKRYQERWPGVTVLSA